MIEIGLIGKKIGMTREFFKSGQSVPITVIKVERGRVIQIINENDLILELQSMNVALEKRIKNASSNLYNLENGISTNNLNNTILSLINADMSREEAYRIVHDCAMRSWDNREDFRELMRTEKRVKDLLTLKNLDALFDYGYYIRHVDETFERAGLV